MKTLKTLSAALLIVLSTSAFATADVSPASKAKMNYTLSTYIDAICKGKIKGIAQIFDPSMKYSISNGTKISTMSKSELVEHFKSFENIEQNCESKYEVVEATENHAIVKLSMQYDSFVKNNLITLNMTDKGWKITNISVDFNSK